VQKYQRDYELQCVSADGAHPVEYQSGRSSAGTGRAARPLWCRATVGRTNVVIRREEPDTLTLSTVHTFFNQFANHADELRMRPRSPGANHGYAQFFAKMAGRIVKVVQDFHMI
jgi:hypothetical protein